MPNILKKSIASLLIAVLLFSSFIIYFPRPAKAGLEEIFGTGPWHYQSLAQYYVKVHDKDNPDEVFGERYTTAQVDWIIWSVLMWVPSKLTGTGFWTCIFTGDIKTCWDTIISDSEQADYLALVEKNQEPTEEKKLHELVFEERGFSGITYVKNVLRNASLIPQANAQGFGYNSALAPVQTMWQSARNIAYIFFVLVTIIMAFMIMFRVKIAPQVIITVQSALPKIAIAIILVTFSYAIAGLLVDLMYVVFGFVSLLGKGLLKNTLTAPQIFTFITSGPTFTIPVLGGRVSLGIIGASFIYLILFAFTSITIFFLSIFTVVSEYLGILFAAKVGIPVTIFVAIILIPVLLVIYILIVIVSLKTTWMLFKTYVSILLLTIFAPFQIVLGILVPSMGIGAWLKSYVSKLAVFVSAGLLLLMSFYFLLQSLLLAFTASFGADIAIAIINIVFKAEIKTVELGATEAWPPLLKYGLMTDTKGFSTAFIFLMISLVLFTFIPKVDSIIKSIMDKRPFAYGTAIGEAMGVAATPITYPVQKSFGAASEGIQKGASRRLADKITQQDTK